MGYSYPKLIFYATTLSTLDLEYEAGVEGDEVKVDGGSLGMISGSDRASKSGGRVIANAIPIPISTSSTSTTITEVCRRFFFLKIV